MTSRWEVATPAGDLGGPLRRVSAALSSIMLAGLAWAVLRRRRRREAAVPAPTGHPVLRSVP